MYSSRSDLSKISGDAFFREEKSALMVYPQTQSASGYSLSPIQTRSGRHSLALDKPEQRRSQSCSPKHFPKERMSTSNDSEVTVITIKTPQKGKSQQMNIVINLQGNNTNS